MKNRTQEHEELGGRNHKLGRLPPSFPKPGRNSAPSIRSDLTHHLSPISHSLSEAQDPLAFRKTLLDTKGLGPWSAEYISLRAIGDTDAFPRTDLVLKRALERHPNLDLESLKPWRSYAAIYLWKEFAQSLTKKNGRNENEARLQRNRIASR